MLQGFAWRLTAGRSGILACLSNQSRQEKSETRRLLKLLLRLVGAASILPVCFLVIHTVHFLYFPVRVVLYDALLDGVITLVLAIVALLALRRRLFGLTPTETGLCLTIGFMATVIYAISVPTIIDRSLSIYFLEKLAQRGGAIRQAAWDDIVRTEYMREHRIVDIRLTEQLHSGTITIENGCVRLTPRGELIARISRFYRLNLLPKKREIMNKLTDDLTDPFRNSVPAATPYACD